MKKIFTLLILLFVILPFTACDFGDDGSVGDAYRFLIMATYGSFEGYYMIDGGSPKFFSSTEATDTIFTSFEQNLSAPESIYVFATGDLSTTSISIYIYAESKIVKSITANQTKDSEGNLLNVTATLSYDF